MKFATRTIPALISLLLFCTVVNSVPSRANGFTDGAEKFVKSLASSAISSLTSKTLTDKERKNNFRALLRDYFNIQGIGKWALGRYWRKASQSKSKMSFKQAVEFVDEVGLEKKEKKNALKTAKKWLR